ncbi:LIC_11904 family protein [Leptospira kmetyi]|uniref:6-bladed beta-propeller n=1 Tax=Leptospira kmetyi TaxID=408139 RepID=A0ABX4N649_9LEPT|nr:hypothetical protein [Leptospira kmetyi]PJZ28781.1 hypothetical protein CH378_16430 [Leptospira kmetyi]PJZ39564.1 hypothetical protein CH370_20880 [Leptospira kmetyi]
MFCKGEGNGNKNSSTLLQIANLFSQNSDSANRSGSGGESLNLQSSNIESNFQINPEIMENVGFLYTRNLNFPELRRIQDFSIVHLSDTIRDVSLAPNDVNLFILDSLKGNILYSTSTNTIKYFHDNRLENYRQIYVLPSGKIVLISSDYFLDFCYSFTSAGTIAYTSGCTKSNIGAIALFEFKPDSSEILILNQSKQLRLLNASSNSVNTFNLNPQPTDIFSIAYNNGYLGVLENKGSKLSLYQEGGGKFTFADSKEDFTFVTSKGVSYQTTQFLSLAIGSSGMVYAVSPSDDSVYSFDNELRIKDVYEFLPAVRPYRKILRPEKILISKKNEFLYVSNRSALEVLKDAKANPTNDIQWSIPVQSDSIETVFKNLINSKQYNPQLSIFDQPGIKEIVQSWKGSL